MPPGELSFICEIVTSCVKNLFTSAHDCCGRMIEAGHIESSRAGLGPLWTARDASRKCVRVGMGSVWP